MIELKKQAVELIQNVPDDKMAYVIDILKWLNGLLCDRSLSLSLGTNVNARDSVEIFEAWKGFRKYKGIIDGDIDEKAELALARDERYADFT